MDTLQKELKNRKADIYKEIRMLFKENMEITDMNIPEVDDKEVAKILVDLLQEALDEVKKDVLAGKYDYY